MDTAIQNTQTQIQQFKKVNFKNKDIKDFALLLLKNGFRVFVYDVKNTKDLIFEKNKNIGYCQLNDFIGFSFSTKHKPNRQTGTGYQTETEVLKPSVQNALNCFIFYPNWTKKSEIKSIIKYKDINEYLKENNILNYIELKL